MAVEKTKLNGVLPIKPSIFEDFRGNYTTGCVMRRCPNTDKLKALTGFEAKEMLGDVFPKMYSWYMEKYSQMDKDGKLS